VCGGRVFKDKESCTSQQSHDLNKSVGERASTEAVPPVLACIHAFEGVAVSLLCMKDYVFPDRHIKDQHTTLPFHPPAEPGGRGARKPAPVRRTQQSEW
jgi:hypothetical protein